MYGPTASQEESQGGAKPNAARDGRSCVGEQRAALSEQTPRKRPLPASGRSTDEVLIRNNSFGRGGRNDHQNRLSACPGQRLRQRRWPGQTHRTNSRV